MENELTDRIKQKIEDMDRPSDYKERLKERFQEKKKEFLEEFDPEAVKKFENRVDDLCMDLAALELRLEEES